MTLYELWQRDPKAALERAFAESKDELFCWTCEYGTDCQTYGSYKWVRRASLEGRTYLIEMVDYAIGILWLDVMYDHRLHKVVPLEEAPSFWVRAP